MKNDPGFNGFSTNQVRTDAFKTFITNTPLVKHDDDRRVLLHLLDQTQGLSTSTTFDLSKHPEIGQRLYVAIKEMTAETSQSNRDYDYFLVDNNIKGDIFAGAFGKENNKPAQEYGEDTYVMVWFTTDNKWANVNEPALGTKTLVLAKDDFHDVPLPQDIIPDYKSPQQKIDDALNND